MTVDFSSFNYLAVAVAVVLNMVAGAFWYSPVLFAKPWTRLTGITNETVAQRRSETYRGYAIAAVASIVIVMALAILVQLTGATTALDGLVLGLLGGVGFAATSQAASYAFEFRPLPLYLINVGYSVIANGAIGVLLALWR